jgi:hypothetical protein
VEHALEVGDKHCLVASGKAKNAATIDMDARHARDQVHGRCHPSNR